MKYLLLITLYISINSIAQSKNAIPKKPSLIESITSDTVNGKFNQVFFSYDQLNRVVSIIKKEIIITMDSNNTNSQVERITEKQDYQYKGSVLAPFSRRIEYDEEEWYLDPFRQRYFLYKNGKRVGDSPDPVNNQTQIMKRKGIGKLEQSRKRIFHKIDISRPYIERDGGTNTYSTEFTLTPQSNISHESSEHDNPRTDASYCTFLKYDSMLNPLKQLNIASSLANEKISFTPGGKYGSKIISWYFVNQNNFLNLYITTDERNSPLKDIYSFSYVYNQFKQPIYAFVKVKEESRDQGYFYQAHEKRFTFRYKNILKLDK